MSSTLVTQSLIASFTASLSVREPLDLGPEQLHPHHVQPLAAGVFLAHVDDAFFSVERSYRSRRDAVLACAGLGDDPLLAHPVGEQDLA